jgi:glucose/arabinose dehydrogenase
MHGIAFDGNQVFLATVNDVYTSEVRADGSFGPLRRIINDLPDGGQHPNRTLGIGPDGMLYISAGSTCNACAETNPENATILRAKPDGGSRTIFASGLRNTIGFDWEPSSGQLWGMDHGIDWLGDEAQIEELNHIRQGKQYGWPYVFGMGEFNPQDNPPNGITLEKWAEMSEEPALGYTAHSAPMQLAFYDGAAFPQEYQGDAFVAMRGSWNRRPPSGYEVVRVDFERGQPVSIEPFLTGFLVEQEGDTYGFLARLAGLAVGPDGALYIADDAQGVIYRVAYDAPAAALAPTAAVPNPILPPPPPRSRSNWSRRPRGRLSRSRRLLNRMRQSRSPMRPTATTPRRRSDGRRRREPSPSSSSWMTPTPPSRSPSFTGSPTTSPARWRGSVRACRPSPCCPSRRD